MGSSCLPTLSLSPIACFLRVKRERQLARHYLRRIRAALANQSAHYFQKMRSFPQTPPTRYSPTYRNRTNSRRFFSPRRETATSVLRTQNRVRSVCHCPLPNDLCLPSLSLLLPTPRRWAGNTLLFFSKSAATLSARLTVRPTSWLDSI